MVDILPDNFDDLVSSALDASELSNLRNFSLLRKGKLCWSCFFC